MFYDIDSWFNRLFERLNLHDYFSCQGKFTHFFKSFIFSPHSKTMAILMQWSSLQKEWVNLCQKSFMRSTFCLIDCLRGLTCMIIFHIKVDLLTFSKALSFLVTKIMVVLKQWSSLQKALVNLYQKCFIILTLGLIDCLRGLTCMIIFHVKVNLLTF